MIPEKYSNIAFKKTVMSYYFHCRNKADLNCMHFSLIFFQRSARELVAFNCQGMGYTIHLFFWTAPSDTSVICDLDVGLTCVPLLVSSSVNILI
jgi:Predicted N-acetylglucosaminyl transferase